MNTAIPFFSSAWHLPWVLLLIFCLELLRTCIFLGSFCDKRLEELLAINTGSQRWDFHQKLLKTERGNIHVCHHVALRLLQVRQTIWEWRWRYFAVLFPIFVLWCPDKHLNEIVLTSLGYSKGDVATGNGLRAPILCPWELVNRVWLFPCRSIATIWCKIFAEFASLVFVVLAADLEARISVYK